jgi:nitrite reductase/ring-hydroxylating ferredoxin subunit
MKQPIAKSTDVPEGGRIVFDVAGSTIGLFRAAGSLYAYENTCPHQGGPVCQGLLIARVEEQLNLDQTAAGFRFDPSDPRIVCPWHGYEFSITTGLHPGNPKIRLRSFEVSEEEGIVYVGI